MKKSQIRPVVGFGMADEFNKVVFVDLKEFKSQSGKLSWILHLADSATRYSAATLVSTKNKDVTVSCDTNGLAAVLRCNKDIAE